jgi:hypothetical protein
MGNPVPLRKPHPTLVGIAPESQSGAPSSRSPLSTRPGGFESPDELDVDVDIELDMAFEAGPANDVAAASADGRDSDPISHMRRVTRPQPQWPPSQSQSQPPTAIALPTEQEMQAIRLAARRERVIGVGIVILSATLMLSLIALLAAFF